MHPADATKPHIHPQGRFARYALAFVLVIAFLLPNSLASKAQKVTSSLKVSQSEFASLPENTRLRIMLAMIKSGNQDEAEGLLQSYPLTGNHSANRTLFLHGLIAKQRKQYSIAIRDFRTVLASDPNLTMVRAELAHALFITEQDDGAKHNLKLLAGAAPTPQLAKQFDQFIDAIDARAPWKMSAYISMAPSTNFNNGTEKKLIPFGGGVLVIDSKSRKKSGIGIKGGANISRTFRPGKDLSVVAGVGANMVQYQGKTFDDFIFSQNVSLVRKHKKGQISIGLSSSLRRAGEEEFIIEGGPHISITQYISNKVQLFSKLRYLQTDFRQSDYRNGHTITFDNRLSNSFGSSTVLYLLAGAQRTKTTLKHLNYWAGYGGVGLYKELPKGITLYAEGRLTRKYYDGDFPLLNEPETDTRIDIVTSLTKRDFEIYGFAPRIDYIYSKSTSNTPFSRYSTHGANITLTKAF